MEETICSLEIIEDEDIYKAKVQTGQGRYKEYKNERLELLLDQLFEDITEELL
ncbi:MAG: hypothetical protein ACOC85_00070 [Thermoplasmatota archaeon]